MLSQPLDVQSVNMSFHKAVDKWFPPPPKSLKDFRSREGKTFSQDHTANLWYSWALLPTWPYSRALAFSLLCVAFWYWFCSSLVLWFWFTMSLGNFGNLRKKIVIKHCSSIGKVLVGFWIKSLIRRRSQYWLSTVLLLSLSGVPGLWVFVLAAVVHVVFCVHCLPSTNECAFLFVW